MPRIRRYLNFRAFDRESIIHSRPGRYQDRRPVPAVKLCTRQEERRPVTRNFFGPPCNYKGSPILFLTIPYPRPARSFISGPSTCLRLFHSTMLLAHRQRARKIPLRGWNNSRLAASDSLAKRLTLALSPRLTGVYDLTRGNIAL